MWLAISLSVLFASSMASVLNAMKDSPFRRTWLSASVATSLNARLVRRGLTLALLATMDSLSTWQELPVVTLAVCPTATSVTIILSVLTVRRVSS